jgi:flagellar assembly protein FliH
MSSSPESRNPVLRGTVAESAAAARFAVDLRNGVPADSEAVERAKQQGRAAGYAEGWAQGQREAAVVADDAQARAPAAQQAHHKPPAAAPAEAV